MELIHYGSAKYDPEKFVPILNMYGGWIKPAKGGLWTSPVDSAFGWIDYCVATELRTYTASFTVELKPEAKILTIDSFKDLENILEKYEQAGLSALKFTHAALDFEKIAQDYDAIHVTAEGQERTRHTQPSLNGWDCESVLVLNKDAIIWPA